MITAAVSKPAPKCRTCGGTGWQWFMKSWFRSDGLRRERCGICGGTKHSSYRGDPECVQMQAKRREEIGR